jgi:ABC-type transport system substrate-binding protein
MQGYNLGAPFLWDALVVLNGQDNYFPDLAARIPTSANGDIRVTGGNEEVTVHLKPNLRWSDGSPITPADYMGALVLEDAPCHAAFPLDVPGGGDFVIACGGASIKSAIATSTRLTITFDGIIPYALDGLLPAPFPMEYFQRKYHVSLPTSLLGAYQAARVMALYTSRSYPGSPLQRLVTAWQGDPYTSPQDVFSGPYKVASWTSGQQAVLVANPYYTTLPPAPHHPRLARIVYELLGANAPTSARALAALSTSTPVDLVFVVDVDTLPMHGIAGYGRIIAPNGPEYLELNQANPALRDQRVRQALFYGLDKAAYMQALYPTLTTAEQNAVAETSVIWNASPWSNNRDLPHNPYNPAKARALLAAAGYANSPGAPGRHLRFDFYTTGLAFRVRSARALQGQWARLGITLTIHYATQRGPGGLLAPYANGGIVSRRRFDIAEFASGGTTDPFVLQDDFDPSKIPDRNHPDGLNYAGVRDLTLFNYLAQAGQTIDEAQRRRLYDQFQNAMLAKAYWIPLSAWFGVMLVKPTLGNFVPSPLGWWAWNAFEWYRS